jgi:A/G-specific adenine glycosylase
MSQPNGNPQKFSDYNRLTTELTDWFSRSARSLPWRETRDPYQVLISEFMLQQTQVATVIPYFKRWIQQFPTFESLANADEQVVLRAWEGLGYYSRARNLHRAAQEVLRKHGGNLPADTPAIRSLPGVGPYTAGAISSFAFDIPEPAIDANVQRVLARLFNIRDDISSTGARFKLDDHARKLLASASPNHGAINAAIMELGALICTSGTPECHRCPVSARCMNRDKASDLPVKRPKPKPTQINEFALWDLSSGGILLELRHGPRWRGLWTLPELPAPPTPVAPLLVQRFAVTRFHISLHILPTGHPTSKSRKIDGPGLQRIPLSNLPDLPLAAPHRRALENLQGQLELILPLPENPSA